MGLKTAIYKEVEEWLEKSAEAFLTIATMCLLAFKNKSSKLFITSWYCYLSNRILFTFASQHDVQLDGID